MNITSPFSILLSLLFLSTIQCYHWDGNTMYDLEYQGENFDTEAMPWTSSMPLVTAGAKTTQCGSNTLLGGYNIMGGNSQNFGKWSRTYSDLPSHNTIRFQGKFYMIDSWDITDDHFHLSFDSSDTVMWWISSNYANYASVNLCGNLAYKDLDPMTIYFTVPHTATTLTFAMSNHFFQKTSDLQSVGFRDIIMTFSTESPVPSRTYCGVTSGYPLNGNACSCGTGTSMTFPNSGVCSVCDPSCLTCNGAGPSMCTSCVAGEYLQDGSCYPCDPSCKTCNGAGPSVCTTCSTGTYFDSGSCYLCDPSCLTCNGAGPSMCASCSAEKYLDGNSCYLCDSSCKTCNKSGSAACTSCEVGEFLSNSSCYASCEDPLVKSSSGGVDYCTTPCPGQYAFLKGECSSSCERPRIQTIMNGFAVCTFPCPDSEYFYDYEKKCYPTCEFPYNIEVIDTIKFCRTDILLSRDDVIAIQKTSASIENTGKATSAGMKASSVINSNNPSSALLAGLSAMMQYIRYMKINFPPKVQMLFKVSAGNPISSSFGVRIPSLIKENLSDDPLPYAFDKYNINSNFVSNLWDFMVSLILMLLAILVLTVLKFLTSKYRRINMVVSRLLQALKWNFPIMMICGSSGDIVFFASLQLRSSPFTGLSSTICCIVSIIMMVLVVLLLIMAFKIARTIRKGRQNLEQEKLDKKVKWRGFEILYVEYEENSFFSLAYMFLFLSRNIIFNLTLATLFEYPLLECCIINGCNFLMISYLIYLRPLKDLLALVQLWINEGLLNIFSINVLILAILDYMEVQQQTTRDGMQEAILFVIKAFNFTALAFMVLAFLVFMRSAYRIWKTGRAKGMRSPLQMFNFLFSGDDEEEEKAVEKENEFSKKNLQIEKEFRENNNNQSTIDMKGDTSLVNINCETTIIQDTSMKILQTEFIQRDFEISPQIIVPPRGNIQIMEAEENVGSRRIRKVNLKRRNRIVEETNNNSGMKNDDAENNLWLSKLRQLQENRLWLSKLRQVKARSNDNPINTDFKFEMNMMNLH